jgi:hypothetical protein
MVGFSLFAAALRGSPVASITHFWDKRITRLENVGKAISSSAEMN